MVLRDVFIGGLAPFQGDRGFRLRSIPAGARIARMTARVFPLGGPAFTQEVSFAADGTTFGATKTKNNDWVEVDFHSRRTLVSVGGANLSGPTLQADFGGGAYVNISQTGAFLSPPPDKPFTFTTAAGGALPGLAVTKFKFTRGASGGATPDVTSVVIRTTPSNVSLRLGTLGPFWTHAGDFTVAETTPDAAPILQAFLAQAPLENGFYDVPLVLHTDSLAVMAVGIELEFSRQDSALDAGLADVVVPYDLSGMPPAHADVLSITVPRGARVVPAQTTARVKGAFDETRVASGPIGPLTGELFVEVSGRSGQAQPLMLKEPVAAIAIDLLIKAIGASARVTVDIRGDLAGKPDSRSLLTRPAELSVDPLPDGREQWMSVPLPEEVRLNERTPYWLVMQGLAGTVQWSANAAAAVDRVLQRTEDGGLSWRLTTPVADERAAARAPGPSSGLTTLLRLRSNPKAFTVPVEVEVGPPNSGIRTPLDRFAPLGRVDFSPVDEIAKVVTTLLTQSTAAEPPLCPEVELLANADFTNWALLTNESGLPAEWTLGGGTARPLRRDGTPAEMFALFEFLIPSSGPSSFAGVVLSGLDASGKPVLASLSQVLPVSPSCTYELSIVGVSLIEDALAELSWRDAPGTLLRVDSVTLVGVPDVKATLQASRIRVAAPATAAQAEVRFRVKENASLALLSVSLAATTNRLSNPDLQAGPGWRLEPRTAPGVKIMTLPGFTTVSNSGTADAAFVQMVAATANEEFVLDVAALVGDTASHPISLQFLRADRSPAGAPIAVVFNRDDGAHLAASGTVPADATQAEVRLGLPKGTRTVVRSLSLRFSTPRGVPIRFVAEAPGELRVTDLRVGFDRDAVPAPPVPPTGLHAPTPAAEEVTDEPCDDTHCPCCGARNSMVDGGRSRTDAGRPAVVGKCRDCGAPVVRLGGDRPSPHSAERPFLEVGRFFAQPLPTSLTAIAGVGNAREKQLIKAGIDSFEKLAAAKPQDVAAAMVGVPVKAAPHYIKEAQRLVELKERVGKRVLRAAASIPGLPNPYDLAPLLRERP